ncbi:choice-of-anchor J domain-containing protein [Psychroserpens algicola]|uniref:choice-of-anchor J domain-containing protein n=1 Tax=Psychroserpens algicola TaxID=1719034 RepID=UPI001953C2AD|nr:choice-of-anchor J domain-containing protein [Psychroserpens algicola]
MKRIVYVLAFLGAIFTGCDPVEDINNDLANQDNPVIGDVEYTLTDDDYDELELDFGNFSSDEDARIAIPGLLADRYPFFGDGSSALVTYNLFVGSAEGVSDYTGADTYEFTNADYATTGSDAFGFYPNVDPTEEIPAVLSAQIAAPTEGQIVLVEYDQYVATPEIGLANLYSAEFPADYDSFESIDVSGPADLGWTVGSSNVQGSGFTTMPNAVEEWLVSPEIDLTGQSDLLLQITQEIDFLGDDTLIDILVSTDYTTGGDIMAATWEAFAFDKTIYGNLTTSEDFDFSDYDDETIHIALKYSSTDSDSPRWRVQDLAVRAIGVSGETDAKGEYFVYEGGEWEAAEGVYYLSTSDYDSMGEGSGQPGAFNNFSSGTPADNYLPTFLELNYPFAQEEDEIFVIYKYFSSNSGLGTRGNLYTYTNGEWIGHESVIETSLQFGLENGIWVPDNTIRYTLEGSDYSLAAAALIDEPGFEAAAGNLDNFGNFNRTGGSTNWSDEMMITALGLILDNLDPGAAEEQKYIVTVDVYIGSNATEDFSLIKMGGEWVAN